MKKGMNKRGQLTLFIIMAIVIVAIVLVFFLIVQPRLTTTEGNRLNFENCVEDSVGSSINDLALKAGFTNPEFTYSYNGEDIPYLCYTNEDLKTCVVQKPFLKQHFEEQVKLNVREEIDACYSASIDELKNQGYDVQAGTLQYNVLFEPEVVRVEIDAPTSVDSQSFSRFNIVVQSSIYEMLMIATSVLQYESQYGDADVSSLNVLYPNYVVRKMKRGDGTTIYSLEDKILKTKFQFASRSLVWPAGYVQK